MATSQRQLSPLRIKRNLHPSGEPEPLSTMPIGLPNRPVASDRLSPTEGNGTDLPPAHLHIALVVPNLKAWRYIKEKVFVIQPPYWPGTVELHVLPENPQSRWSGVDWVVRQALVDSGLATPDQVDFAPPINLTFGWPAHEPT